MTSLINILREKAEPASIICYRATREGLAPTAFSSRGGRWSEENGVPALYTSLARDGALAEIAFHWSRLSPPPTKPVIVHRLMVDTACARRLDWADLEALGVDRSRFGDVGYKTTGRIGTAAAEAGIDALIVPSARWPCENMVLFNDPPRAARSIRIIEQQMVDWQAWVRAHAPDDAGRP